MNKKYLFGSIALIFIAIVFFVPLSKDDSKSSKMVKEIITTTNKIVKSDSEKNKDIKDIPKNKTFYDIAVKPYKNNSLKKHQLSQNKNEIKNRIELTLAKLENSKPVSNESLDK